MVDLENMRRQPQREAAQKQAADEQGNDGQRRERRSRRTERDDQRQNEKTIDQAFGQRPDYFAEGERFGIDGRGENSVVSRLINHPKIRAVSHLENRAHQNRKRQNAGADKRKVAQAFDLRSDQRADAETEGEKSKNRLDNRRDKLGFPEPNVNARVSLPDRKNVGQINFGKRQIHYL